MEDITLEKINKTNGQIITQDDIAKIDSNMQKIETNLNELSIELFYSEFVI